MRRMTIKEIAEAVSGSIFGKEYIKQDYFDKVSTDSRVVGNNTIFIPLKGERFDAHNFIQDVYNSGVDCVISARKDMIPENKCAIIVQDTQKALIDLAKFIRNEFQGILIGITGSVGKTSCKQMLGDILSTQYKVHKTEGNFNNNIGLPLTILKAPEDTEIMILEMGMNHFGEIDLLGSISKPDYAVITNIGMAHIENLGSKEGILQAKAEIIKHIKPNGMALLNGDNEYLLKLAQGLTVDYTLFGFSENNHYQIESYEDLTINGSTAVVKTPSEQYNIQLNAIGVHMLYHAAAGIAIGEALGISSENICKGIENYENFKMRMEKIQLNNKLIINDTYNASVDSMKAALELMKNAVVKGRKVVILGDMREMGTYAEAGHKEVGMIASKSNLDFIIAVGDSAKYIVEALIHHSYPEENIKYYKSQVYLMNEIETLIQPLDTILVKASRGMKLENTIEKIKEVN